MSNNSTLLYHLSYKTIREIIRNTLLCIENDLLPESEIPVAKEMVFDLEAEIEARRKEC